MLPPTGGQARCSAWSPKLCSPIPSDRYTRRSIVAWDGPAIHARRDLFLWASVDKNITSCDHELLGPERDEVGQ